MSHEKQYTFNYDSNKRIIYHKDKVIGRLNAMEGRVLVALVKNENGIIERDALLDIAWPDKYVTPNSLNVAIKKIRTVFRPITEKEVVITHFKRGFSWNHRYIICDLSVDFSNGNENDSDTITFSAVSEELVDENEISETKDPSPNDSRLSINKYFLISFFFSTSYCLLCSVLAIFIIFVFLFYTTQVKLMSCHNIGGYELCGYGQVSESDIPHQLSPGRYLYVNSSENGFRYTENN